MIVGAGHGRDASEVVASLLIHLIVQMPITPLVADLCQALTEYPNWPGDMPMANVDFHDLAEWLVMRLDQSGWCLSDLESGEVRALLSSDLDDLARATVEGTLSFRDQNGIY